MEGRRLWESWSAGLCLGSLPLRCWVEPVRGIRMRVVFPRTIKLHALSFAIVAEEGRVQRLWKTKH